MQTLINGTEAPSKIAELMVSREGSSNQPWIIDLQKYDFTTEMGQKQLTITAHRNRGDLRFWQMHEEIGLECTLRTQTHIQRFKAQMEKAYEIDIPGLGRYQSAEFAIEGPLEDQEEVIDFSP
jgi:hypothetical protein